MSGLAATIMACVLAACSATRARGGFAPSGAPSAPSDGGEAGKIGDAEADTTDAGPWTCIFDCFRGETCFEGKATSYGGFGGTLPCDTPQEIACPPRAPYTCTEGCAVEIGPFTLGSLISTIVPRPLTIFCAETPSKKVGDPCANDLDCLPNRAHVASDGSIETLYLASDQASQTCVAGPGPRAADFGASCASPGATTSGIGYAAGPQCPQAYCLHLAGADAGCGSTACTGPCWGDHQCPPGWACDDSLTNLSPQGFSAPAPVCRPGLAHTPLPRGFCGGAPDGGGSD
jgi:hypothetical protein